MVTGKRRDYEIGGKVGGGAVMGEHTPGPWQACHEGTCGCGMVWSIPGDFPVAAALSTCKMWETYNLGSGLKPQAGEREANSRLIAAAPDLLKACKEMLKSFDCAAEHSIGKSRELASAAIAKAEGTP